MLWTCICGSSGGFGDIGGGGGFGGSGFGVVALRLVNVVDVTVSAIVVVMVLVMAMTMTVLHVGGAAVIAGAGIYVCASRIVALVKDLP